MVLTYERNVEFIHYGVKGQKWGIRRYQNPDGTLTTIGKKHYSEGTLKKGTVVRRIALDSKDKTYDNKKYVSLTDSDNDKWNDYLSKGYGKEMQNLSYILNNDVKIASAAEQGKIFTDHFMNNSESVRKVARDTVYYAKVGKDFINKDLTPEKIAGVNVAWQTETGKNFVKALKDLGYGAMEDVHGRNVADNPIVIFDPDKNLTRKNKKKNSIK